MLGGDAGQRSLPLSDSISLVYSLDTQRHQLPSRTRITVIGGFAPSIAAAQFSGFAIIPKFPCYLTRFSTSSNIGWVIADVGGTFPLFAVDVPPQFAWLMPDGSAFRSQTDSGQKMTAAAGVAGIPILFNQFDTGRFAVSPGGTFQGTGELLPTGVSDSLYLAAGRLFLAAVLAANTTSIFQMAFEFTAQAQLAQDPNGVTLLPR